MSAASAAASPALTLTGPPSAPPPPALALAADSSTPAPERPTLTVQETASLLGISRWLVQEAVRRGELPVVRIGRRILIPRARLLALLAGQPDPAVHKHLSGPGGPSPAG